MQIFTFAADDGEVFKVKKSSRSKKLMKQLDHERKKKKGEEKMQVDSESANMSVKQEKDLEIKTDDLVVSYLYDVLLVLISLLLSSSYQLRTLDILLNYTALAAQYFLAYTVVYGPKKIEKTS